MAGQFSKTDQRRITFLSLLSSAATVVGTDPEGESPYTLAQDWLQQMEADGFFEENRASNPTRAPSGRSDRQASSSRSSRSSDRPSNGRRGFRDPNAPASDGQVNFALKLGADYSREELEDMTMGEIGALIDDLKD